MSCSKDMIDIIVLDGSHPKKEKYPRESLTKNNGWEECPIPTMLGVPLMAKPIRPYPGARPTNQPAVFLMAEPIEGYVPCRWQLGPRCDPGMIGFGRRDGKPLTVQQWTDLHSFIDTLMDLYSMLVDSQIIISEKISLENYTNYLRSIQSPLAGQLQQPVYMCSRCDRLALNKCSRCRFTLYCSKECQSADWKEEHGKMCCKFFYKRESEREWLATMAPRGIATTSANYVLLSRASESITIYNIQ